MSKPESVRVGIFDVVKKPYGHRATCRKCHAVHDGEYAEDLAGSVHQHVCGTARQRNAKIPADLPHRPPPPAPRAPARKLPAYLDCPRCPKCSASCGVPGLEYAQGHGQPLFCAACGHTWSGTLEDIEQAFTAFKAWLDRTDDEPGPYLMVVKRRALHKPHRTTPQVSLFESRSETPEPN